MIIMIIIVMINVSNFDGICNRCLIESDTLYAMNFYYLMIQNIMIKRGEKWGVDYGGIDEDIRRSEVKTEEKITRHRDKLE